MKKTIICLSTFTLFLMSCNQVQEAKDKTKENIKEAVKENLEKAVLSDEEKTAGFKLLFNGFNTEGWHPYRTTKEDSLFKWKIEEGGVLHTKGGHIDMVSDSSFENFEVRFDWKVGKSGNSGFIYMVQENEPKTESTWNTGIEYQVIDYKGWPDSLHPSQKAGAVYDLYDPLVLADNPAGEWNTAKIICNKGHIEHYLNGQKTADYIWNSKDYLARFAKSKFKAMPFAKKVKGQFALQDHGQEVAFRNIRIKAL